MSDPIRKSPDKDELSRISMELEELKKDEGKIVARTLFALEPATFTQTIALGLVKKLFF